MGFLKACVAASVFLLGGYVFIILMLSLPTPQELVIYLHWINFPFFARFDQPEYYGFAHNKVRNVKIVTQDNVTLGAWHILPSAYYQEHSIRDQTNLSDSIFDAALADPQHDTVLYFHGNAANRVAPWRVDLYKRLGDKFNQLNIIAIDYRGYGDSDGWPSERGLEMDAEAALNWLNERQVPNNRISIIGHSLGTGVATSLAYEMTTQGKPPKALILKAAYSSLPTLIFEYRMLKYIPILAPVKHIPSVQGWVVSKLLHKFDSISKIEAIDCPILIMYGQKDIEIPVHNSQQLFHRALYGAVQPFAPQHWADQHPDIVLHRITNEATVYSSQVKPNVLLVSLEYADHNDVSYFDYTYQAMYEVTGWH